MFVRLFCVVLSLSKVVSLKTKVVSQSFVSQVCYQSRIWTKQEYYPKSKNMDKTRILSKIQEYYPKPKMRLVSLLFCVQGAITIGDTSETRLTSSFVKKNPIWGTEQGYDYQLSLSSYPWDIPYLFTIPDICHFFHTGKIFGE